MMKKRRMRWAGNVALMAETRNAYRILVGKPEGKRPLGIQCMVYTARSRNFQAGISTSIYATEQHAKNERKLPSLWHSYQV
jgi:hypothetical protein